MRANELRKAYREFYSRLEEILFRHDPVGINLVENKDEYDPEVSAILPRLNGAKSEKDFLDIVYEEFVHWFNAETAGNKDSKAYIEASKEIWAAWNEYQKKART